MRPLLQELLWAKRSYPPLILKFFPTLPITLKVNQAESIIMFNELSEEVCSKATPQDKIDTPCLSNDIYVQIQAIINSFKSVSEINTARVLYFKSEIALGNYKIDSDSIVMKLLSQKPA
jgi:anti-sigma28 factor (negative regulator of flagellin synthesis)